LKIGLGGGIACASIPMLWTTERAAASAEDAPQDPQIRAVVREPVLFAGIRKPIKERAELEPRIEQLKLACSGKTVGPLTHIFRFDTPVDGYDSEIGFPVSAEINTGDIRTHTLRSMHFFALLHAGPTDTLRETTGKLYEYMSQRGLSPELELVEVYHHRDPEVPKNTRIEVMAAFLAWPEVYREQLTRVLGTDVAEEIWEGGKQITPHTLVDDRAAWVAASLARLKARTNEEQQFDVLSRVALKRPDENVMKYKRIYDQARDFDAVIKVWNESLKKTRTGGFVDPPRFDGKILHMSKVPYNRQGYDEAETHEEKRKAYCFCNLVREAADPKIDPIFCYRAAGWDRQFWEPILGVEFKKCRITHSILKGDDFCAWDYHL
jgi:effector-binding domain-containing protein